MIRTKAARPGTRVWAVAVSLLFVRAALAQSAAAGQTQKEAVQEQGIEIAVFTDKGSKFAGEFVDISAPRSVLELKSGREIPLKRIWMINFEDRKWYFPEELKKIETNDNTLFLKDDSIVSGRIIDYNERLKVFELDQGRTVGIDKVRRIYFSKTVPKSLARKINRHPKKEKG